MWNKLQSIHQHHTQCGCNKQKWGRWVQSQPATSPKQAHPGTLAPWVCPKPMVHYKKLPFSCKPRITSRTSRFRGINPFPAWGGSASTLARCGCGFKQVGSLGMSWDQRTRWWDMYIYYICINLHLHILHSQYTYIYIYIYMFTIYILHTSLSCVNKTHQQNQKDAGKWLFPFARLPETNATTTAT